jgi:hypothetical protein
LGLSVWATWVFRWRGVSGAERNTRDDGQDVRLYLDEAKALGVPVEIAEVVARLWEATLNDEGADSDFTSAINRSSGPPASLSAGPKSENGIIAGEEQHYSHRVRLWPLSGAINNRNAYGKPVD